MAEVFLRLLEKDRIQQSSVVVVEFDNHEILVKIGLPERNRVSRPPTKLQTPVSLRHPRFYTACEASRFSSTVFTRRS